MRLDHPSTQRNTVEKEIKVAIAQGIGSAVGVLAGAALVYGVIFLMGAL